MSARALMKRCPHCGHGVLEVRQGENTVAVLDLHTDLFVLERYDTRTGDGAVRKADCTYAAHAQVCKMVPALVRKPA